MTRFAPAIERLTSRPDASRTLGAFRLVHPLGKGGFAPVWLAKEVYGSDELRTVAIKLFVADDDGAGGGGAAGTSTTSRGSSSTQRQRIVEEARALCQVEHPNVVRFHALQSDATTGVVGLVMEHVRGTAVDQRLRDLRAADRTMPPREVLDVGVSVASALAAVHQVGLVHRDVKPANVVESDGVYKLIDFGIAAGQIRAKPKPKPKATERVVVDDLPLVVGVDAPTLASTADSGSTTGVDADSLTGTAGYMDPASLAALSPATAASDLYALGATLFECATGLLPAAVAARRAGAPGLSAEVLDGRAHAPTLADVAPALPPSLCELVDQLLDPDPARRPRSAEAVAWELERVRRELSGRSRPLPLEEVGPFRGLGRFERADRDVYFGRTVELAASIETLRARGLLALIGPSGSGKSSLARAGVLPAVADGDLGRWPKVWDAVVLTPGADARASLSAALSPFVDARGRRSPEEIVAALAERAQSSGRGLVLLVDQLEELVTVSTQDGRDFLAALLARVAAQPIPGLRAVVAARRDLLDPLLALGELGRVLTRATLLVGPMSERTWGDVIDQALGAYGYRFEDEAMRAELLSQLAEAATAMPLVQFALTRLWDQRDRQKRLVTRAALAAIGGLAGALEMHAESVIARCATEQPDAIDAARALVLAMTTPQGTRRARSREAVRGVHESAARVLAALEEERLVTQEDDGVTIAHEVLLTKWKRAERWIEEAREGRLFAEALERDAVEWSARGERELLWKGRRLSAAAEIAASTRVELGDSARAFVRASRAAARRGRVIALALAAATFAAVAGAAVYAAVQAQRASVALGESEVARKAADDQRGRAAQALAESLEVQGRQALFAGDNLRALLYLSSAYEQGKSDATLRFLLAEAERMSDTLIARLEGHRASVDFAAFSPGGGRLVTASADGTARTWDASNGNALVTFDHGSAVFFAAFGDDGDRLLTLGRDGTAKIWDSLGGGLLGTLAGASAAFGPDGRSVLSRSGGVTRAWDGSSDTSALELDETSAAALSQDGKRVAVAYATKSAGEVWDLARRARLFDLRDAGAATAIVFAQQIATTDAAGNARTYDAATGQLVATARTDVPARPPAPESPALDPVRYGHRDKVTSKVARSDGLYATTSRDGTANLWRENRTPRAQPTGIAGGSRYARFSPCGRYVAAEGVVVDARYATVLGHHGEQRNQGLDPVFSADGDRVLLPADGRATILESVSGRVLVELASPSRVEAAALSHDGSHVATAESDRMLRVWDARTGDLTTAVGPVAGTVWTLLFTPDGAALLAFGERTGTRWDVASGAQVARFAGNPGAIMSVDESSDGGRVVAACTDGAARVWEVATGDLALTLVAGSESVDVATFSPDARKIVTGGNDRTARVWDATTGELLVTLEGHTGWVFDASFSPDGERIATAGFDGTARIWEGSSGQLLATLGDGPNGWVASARFSPDGSQLATASFESAITIWDVHAESRSPAEVATLVAERRLPWHIVDGVLRPIR